VITVGWGRIVLLAYGEPGAASRLRRTGGVLLTVTLMSQRSGRRTPTRGFAANVATAHLQPTRQIIDVKRCIGRGRCVQACKAENGVAMGPYYLRTDPASCAETPRDFGTGGALPVRSSIQKATGLASRFSYGWRPSNNTTSLSPSPTDA